MQDDHFDANLNAAQVACRQLGFTDGVHCDAEITPVPGSGEYAYTLDDVTVRVVSPPRVHFLKSARACTILPLAIVAHHGTHCLVVNVAVYVRQPTESEPVPKHASA